MKNALIATGISLGLGLGMAGCFIGIGWDQSSKHQADARIFEACLAGGGHPYWAWGGHASCEFKK